MPAPFNLDRLGWRSTQSLWRTQPQSWEESIETSRLLQVQGEVRLAKAGAEEVVVQTPRAVELQGAEASSGQDYISQWPPRALGPLPLCVLRRPSRLFPGPRRLGSIDSGREVGPRRGYASLPGWDLVFRQFGSAGRKEAGHPDVGPLAFCVTLRVRRWLLPYGVWACHPRCLYTLYLCDYVCASERWLMPQRVRLSWGRRIVSAFFLCPRLLCDWSVWVRPSWHLRLGAMGEDDGETAGTHSCCDLCKMVVGAVVFKNLWVSEWVSEEWVRSEWVSEWVSLGTGGPDETLLPPVSIKAGQLMPVCHQVSEPADLGIPCRSCG